MKWRMSERFRVMTDWDARGSAAITSKSTVEALTMIQEAD